MSGSRDLTAILLSAGVSRRMGSAVPKAMLPLTGEPGGPSFLDRHISVLRDSGVTDVLVVLSSEVARDATIDGATIVVNDFDTSSTGSTLSLLCALEAADLPDDHGLLVADADVVYERRLMAWLVDHCDRSAVFVTPDTAGDDEEVAVWSDADQPKLIGKGLPPAITDRFKLLGESLGVIHIDAPDRPFFRAGARWLAGWPPVQAYGYAKERSEHEELWQYGFTTDRMGAVVVPGHYLCSECDTPADYRYVYEELYPAILAQDEAGDER